MIVVAVVAFQMQKTVPPEAMAGTPGHIGLTSMRERAEMVGGWCTVTSLPEPGTTVEFWVPRELHAMPVRLG